MNETMQIDQPLSQEEYAALKDRDGVGTGWGDRLLRDYIKALRKVRRLQKRIIKLQQQADQWELSKRVLNHVVRDKYYEQEHNIQRLAAEYGVLAKKYHDLQKEVADEKRARHTATPACG